jgi:hypothetical protein
VKKLQDSGAECSKMSKKMFTVKSEMVARERFVKSDASEFQNCCVFPHISCTVLYEIITDRLSYHKFRAMCVPKILTCALNRKWL